MRAIFIGVSFVVALLLLSTYSLFLNISSPRAIVEPQVLAASTVSTDAIENNMIARINSIRRDAGVSAVSFDENLKALATYRAVDMANKRYYSHTSPDGNTFGDYMNQYKNTSTFSCENLQLQLGESADSAISSWVASSSHYRCLVDPRITSIAISFTEHTFDVRNSSGKTQDYYVYVLIASN
jgi:uncharacterized protein YkwD